MPCGGIFPIKGSWVDRTLQQMSNQATRCWQCGELGGDHFVEEWDSAIHGVCVLEFLKTEEGKVVLNHQHPVIVQKPDGTTVDYSLEENRNVRQ